MNDLPQLPASVAELFWRQVDNAPDALAICSDDSCKTYKEFELEANGIAASIHSDCSLDKKNGTLLVALLIEHGDELVTSIMGVMLSGCAYQPLDTSFPEARLQALLASTQPIAIIASDAYIALAERVTPDDTVIFSMASLIANKNENRILRQSTADAPAYLFSTSGTTGLPKSILHNQRNLLRAVSHYCSDLSVNASDNIALILPCTYTPSIFCIFGALLSGATLHPFDLKSRSIEDMGLWIKRMNITLLYSSPTIFRRLISVFSDNTIFGSLRSVQLAGEPLFKSDVVAYQQRFTNQFSLYNGMGTTETSCLTRYVIDSKTNVQGSRVPIGHAYDDVQIKILDASGQEVPEGQEGELYVIGKYFASGYYLNADLSNGQFTHSQDDSGLITYRTGDRAYMTKSGEVIHLGRMDGQIKLRGQRLELGEIEATMLRSKIATEAAVILITETNQAPFLAAFFQPEQDITSIRRYLSEHLPPFMVPNRIISLKALPTNTAGKVDRLALSRFTFHSQIQGEADRKHPEDLIEQSVLNCFRDVLKDQSLHTNSNFFDCGGDSLLAVELAISMHDALAVPINVSSLIEAPTPRAMATEARRYLNVGGVRNLVRFQDDEYESGRAPNNIPIFCLPGIDGNALTFRALASQMLKTRAVYAMEYPGYYGGEIPFETLDELVSICFESINTAYPDGPIALVCYSLGGVVGFELTRKFEAAGRPVQLLALLDCYSPQNMRLRYMADEVKRRIKTLINLGKRRSDETADILEERRIKVNDALKRTTFYYKAKEQHINNMLFIKAKDEGQMWGVFDRHFQWNRLISNAFSAISVEGVHINMIMPHKAFEIAQLINDAMPVSHLLEVDQGPKQVLNTLNDMWAFGNGETLKVNYTIDSNIKPTHKLLLEEAEQLTRRLEKHLKEAIEPKVLTSQQRGRFYYRKVALQTKETKRSVVIASIRIAMDQFQQDTVEEIIMGERPFGTILANKKIDYSCSAVDLFQSLPDNSLLKEFELNKETQPLYGRSNQFRNSKGAVLADVVEILAPWV